MRILRERRATVADPPSNGELLPLAPVRQWVLSLPFGLRFAVAFDRELCCAVRSAFIDTVLGELRRRAAQQGVDDDRSGAVVCVQRFGGSLNLNVHFHALVLDGVFHREAGSERPVFRVARRLSAGDLADVLAAVRAKVCRLLRRRGLLPEDDPSALEDLAQSSPMLAGLQASSIQGRQVLRIGRRWGTAFVQPSGSPSCPTAASPTTCAVRGRTARRASCSSRWPSWRNSRPWCPRRAPIS